MHAVSSSNVREKCIYLERFDFENNPIVIKKIPAKNIRYCSVHRKRTGLWFLLCTINLFRQQRIALGKNGSKKHYKALVKLYLQEIKGT